MIKNPFTNSTRWAKGCLGITKEGNRLHCLDEVPHTEVEAFSLQGWLTEHFSAEREGHKREKMRLRLRELIKIRTGRDIPIAKFNNDPDTSFADVRWIIDNYENKRLQARQSWN